MLSEDENLFFYWNIVFFCCLIFMLNCCGMCENIHYSKMKNKIKPNGSFISKLNSAHE